MLFVSISEKITKIWRSAWGDEKETLQGPTISFVSVGVVSPCFSEISTISSVPNSCHADKTEKIVQNTVGYSGPWRFALPISSDAVSRGVLQLNIFDSTAKHVSRYGVSMAWLNLNIITLGPPWTWLMGCAHKGICPKISLGTVYHGALRIDTCLKQPQKVRPHVVSAWTLEFEHIFGIHVKLVSPWGCATKKVGVDVVWGNFFLALAHSIDVTGSML